jgi:hypothetical protein
MGTSIRGLDSQDTFIPPLTSYPVREGGRKPIPICEPSWGYFVGIGDIVRIIWSIFFIIRTFTSLRKINTTSVILSSLLRDLNCISRARRTIRGAELPESYVDSKFTIEYLFICLCLYAKTSLGSIGLSTGKEGSKLFRN